MAYQHPSDQEIANILKTCKRIAVVGLSNKPDRASFQVAKYMQEAGYEIIPVNPVVDEVLGMKAVKSLSDLDGEVDIINVFRRSEETVPIAEAAARTNAKVFWLQLGIMNEEAGEIAAKAGMKVIMDKCIKVEHHRLLY